MANPNPIMHEPQPRCGGRCLRGSASNTQVSAHMRSPIFVADWTYLRTVLTKTMEAFKQTRLPIRRHRIPPPLTNTIPQWFDGLERTSTTLLGQLRVALERLAFFPFVFELLVQVWVVSDALEVSCLTSRGTQVFSAATRIFLELACRSLLYVLPAAGLSIHGGPA
jgi:hypothetical protein